MEEVYKPIKDFENYQVSNLGNVKNSKGHLISQATNDRGYKHLHLSKDKHKYNKDVHRLVAETFIPNPDNLPVVNHLDENPGNNRADNLEWSTHKYNSNYGTCQKRKSETRKSRHYDCSGPNNSFYGHKHSDSTKDKIRNSRLGTHRVYNEDGTWTMK